MFIGPITSPILAVTALYSYVGASLLNNKQPFHRSKIKCGLFLPRCALVKSSSGFGHVFPENWSKLNASGLHVVCVSTRPCRRAHAHTKCVKNCFTNKHTKTSHRKNLIGFLHCIQMDHSTRRRQKPPSIAYVTITQRVIELMAKLLWVLRSFFIISKRMETRIWFHWADQLLVSSFSFAQALWL